MARDLASEISKGRVQVIREGFEENLPGSRCRAPCTVTLVGCEEGLGIVDPGSHKDHKLLKGRFFPGEVGSVFITHNHPDHMPGYIHYPESVVYTPDSMFKVGNFKKSEVNIYDLYPDDFQRVGGEFHINDEIRLIFTPGHSGWDMSVLHQRDDGPKTAIVGDLFWSERDFYEGNEFPNLCVNPVMQQMSRDYIATRIKPEVIVPGHGPAFVPRY